MLNVIVRRGKAFKDATRRGYHARVYPDRIEVFDLRTCTWREDHNLSENQICWLQQQVGTL